MGIGCHGIKEVTNCYRTRIRFKIYFEKCKNKIIGISFKRCNLCLIEHLNLKIPFYQKSFENLER